LSVIVVVPFARRPGSIGVRYRGALCTIARAGTYETVLTGLAQL